MSKRPKIIGVSSRNSRLGYDQIKTLVSPAFDMPDPIVDLEILYDYLAEFDESEYVIFSHNQHRIPKIHRHRAVIFALQTVVNRLIGDSKVRKSYLEFPPALILTNTETAASDLRSIGLDAKCLYRPSSNLSIPKSCPELKEKPVILWYWKPDAPPMAPYIEETIDIIDSIEDVEIWTFPSKEKPIEKTNVTALGRVDLSEIAPMVDGLVRITRRLDYGRSTFDVLANGRWALYNDMPDESFSLNSDLENIVDDIHRLVSERSNEDAIERHNNFRNYFEKDAIKALWVEEFESFFTNIHDRKKNHEEMGTVKEITPENIVLKGYSTKEKILKDRLFKPRKDCVDWNIPERINYEDSPFEDNNWIFQLNALRIIDPILLEGIESWGDLEFCCNHAIDWIDFNDDIGDFKGFRWHDMATGLRAQKLALLLNMLETQYPEKEDLIDKIKRSCKQHREKLRDEGFISPGNHGVFQIHGLMAVSIVLDDDLSMENFEFCSSKISQMISSQFYEDGIHVENSPEYHFLMIRVFEQILSSGWYENQETDELWKRILEKGCLLVWPDGNIIEVGDSNPAKVSQDFYNGFMEDYSKKISQNDQYVIKKGRSNYISYHSKDSGITVIRSDFDVPPSKASMLFSLSAFKSRAHRHSDDLGFVLFESGQVLVDCGKYAYGKSEGRDFALSTRAHNCLQIDGTDFSRESRDFYDSALSDITHQEWGTLIEIRKMWENLDVIQKRIFAYSPGRFLFTIDLFSGNGEREFKQWFHFHERFNEEFHYGPDSVNSRDGDFKFSVEFFSSSESNVDLSVNRGMVEPLSGWRSKSYNHMTEINSVSSAMNGKEGFLAAFFVFDDKEREVQILEDGKGISVIVNHHERSENVAFETNYS